MNHNFTAMIDTFFNKQGLGCEVDCHYPIRITMKDNAIINLDFREERVVLWTTITDFTWQETERVARLFDDNRLTYQDKTGDIPELTIIDGKIVLSSSVSVDNVLCIDAFTQQLEAFTQCNNGLMC